MEGNMFADSLLESAPHSGNRAGWSKLASALLQTAALAVVLAMPLFHVELLHVLPPPPSIQMIGVQQPIPIQRATSAPLSTAPAMATQIVQPRWIPRHSARVDDESRDAPRGVSLGPPCGASCVNTFPFSDTPTAGPGVITLAQPHPPAPPPRVSQMQLGELVRKVVPEYPILAKQMHVEGTVVLMATIGKDGRVEHVQPVSGQPLLIPPAKRAVEQWQYRPYRLNHETIVVQTEITVNFLLNSK